MLVFWWLGRGYVTALIVFGTMMIFALFLQAMQSVIPDQKWYWGLSLIAAAGVNWKIGSHFNRKRLAKAPRKTLKERLLYRAPKSIYVCPHGNFLGGYRRRWHRINDLRDNLSGCRLTIGPSRNDQ